MTTVDNPPPAGRDDNDIPLKPLSTEVASQRDVPLEAPLTDETTRAGREELERRPAIPPTDPTVGKKVTDAIPAMCPAPWRIPVEPAWGRYVAAGVLVLMLVLYAYVMRSYWAGAHGGVDQAGYMRMAQLIADERALGFVPADPFEFGSRMSIMTEPFRDLTADEAAAGASPYMLYAKYPFGFPLLAAVGRMAAGFDGMYLVNPTLTVLALAFAYLMFRQVLGRFTSLVGVAWLACNPLTLIYSNDANSHASTLFCVCAGFWGLLSWMRTHSWWKGMIGGFALGYACTIRYSEFLLVLPVALAAAVSFGANIHAWWTNRRSPGAFRMRAMCDWIFPVLGWAIPVAALAIVCWVSFGAPWKTGYTYCREDTGFGWKYFLGVLGQSGGVESTKQGNWETLITQMNSIGLFFLWPLSFVGLFGLLVKLPRVGAVLLLWVLPPTFLYMFYYWAPAGETTVGYLRFFLSVVPGLILAGLWVAERALAAIDERRADEPAEHSRLAPLATLTGFAVAFVVIAAWVAYDSGEKFVTEDHFFRDLFVTTGEALWAFVRNPVGWATIGLAAALVTASWIWERSVPAGRAALALALGIATMLGCGIDLYKSILQLENSHARWVQLRQAVDSVREALPAGSIVFADEEACQQFDAIGDYRLYSNSLFAPGAFARFERLVRERTRLAEKNDGEPEPDPYQLERARYYMELLGRKSAVSGIWLAKPTDEVRRAQWELWDKAFAENRPVTFVTRDETLRRDGGGIPQRPGYRIEKVRHWQSVPPPTPPAAAQPARAGRGGGNPFVAPSRYAPRTTNWTIYEIVPPGRTSLIKSLKSGAVKIGPVPAATAPATRPAVPASAAASQPVAPPPATSPASAPVATPATAGKTIFDF